MTIIEEDEYGFVSDGKVFLKAQDGRPSREIGFMKNDATSSLQYFRTRFVRYQERTAEVEQLIEEAENKSSFLMKIRSLRDNLDKANALGNYTPLYQRLDKLEEPLLESIKENQIRNAEIKHALFARLQHILAEPDWRTAHEEIQELIRKWTLTGSVVEEHADIEEQFQTKLNEYFEDRRIYYEERNKVIDERMIIYKDILKKMEEALRNLPEEPVPVLLNKWLADWKKAGRIPRSKADDLWDQFKRYRRLLRRKIKGDDQQRDPDISPEQELNFKKRLQLSREVESLYDREDLESAELINEVKKRQFEWKQAGQVGKSQVRYIFNRFQIACERIFEKNFLLKVARSRNNGFDYMSDAEKWKIKGDILDEFIKRNSRDLQQQTDYVESIPYERRRDPENKITISKYETQKRRIGIKKDMLRESREELDKIENKKSDSYEEDDY